MNGGLIVCSCGQYQYVETVNQTINCIACGKVHLVYPLPEIEDTPVEEGEEDGTDI